MAYTALNLGYTPQAGYEYTATTDSQADWSSVPNSTYFFDKTEKQVFYKDANGGVYGAYVGGTQGSTNTYNVSSTQWNKTLAAPVSLPTGQIANGFTFFDNVADKSVPVVGAVSLGAVVGTGYTTALAVPTTGGTGSGLLLDIVAVGGDVTAVAINDPGTGYTDGDIVTIVQGGGASDDETVTLTVNNAGTTPYDEYDIAYGISITLSGTSGSANINVDGTNYLATFDTDLFTTANNWVVANQAALNTMGIQAFALGSGADGRIRFGATANTILNGITITNVTPNLSGTIANEFTGSSTAAGDHLRVPYVGKPYFGKRILHTIRDNFNIVSGSVQYAELGLFRYANDTQIGSAIIIQRNPDVTGALVVLETYTASPTDSFVTGGFYLALNNNTGQTLEFFGSTGILIQNVFDSATSF